MTLPFILLQENFPKLVNLVQLDLSKNSLTELPHDFGELVKLKKLDLLQNHLSELPLSFRNLKNLVWLDLKANPIQENLPNIVGDCLKPKECQLCAQNVSIFKFCMDYFDLSSYISHLRCIIFSYSRVPNKEGKYSLVLNTLEVLVIYELGNF